MVIASTSSQLFPVWKKKCFSAIDHVIRFLLEMVSFYFKILKLLVILIRILNNRHLQSRCLIKSIYQMTANMHNLSSPIITLGGHSCNYQ